MADIRVTGILDATGTRAEEDPLSYGGRWAAYGSWTDTLKLSNDQAHSWGNEIVLSDLSPSNPQQSHYYWTPTTWDGDVEVWAYFGFQLDDGASLSLGLISSAGGYGASWDGYHLRVINTFSFSGMELWIVTNGSGTKLTTASGSGTEMLPDYLLLFRRSGGNIEGWRSTDSGLNWTNPISYADSTYTTGLNVGVGSSVALVTQYPGWHDVGGGAARNRPQIYRWIKN